jgi:hypothetical protein
VCHTLLSKIRTAFDVTKISGVAARLLIINVDLCNPMILLCMTFSCRAGYQLCCLTGHLGYQTTPVDSIGIMVLHAIGQLGKKLFCVNLKILKFRIKMGTRRKPRHI